MKRSTIKPFLAKCFQSVLLVGLLALDPQTAIAAVRTYSIEQFNKSRPAPGVEVKVEGRVMLVSKTLLRFRNCDLVFQGEDALPDIPRGTANLEVTGEITRETSGKGGRDVFVVSSLKVLPPDEDTFLFKRRLIHADRPEDWYQLADWGEERGRFYKDRELLSQAADARAHGIAIEQRKATRDGPAALLALAAKGGTLHFPDNIRQSLIHAAYYELWKQSQNQPQAQLKPLARDMLRDLPGSEEPFEDAEADLRDRYRIRPLETYDAAEGATRRKIHRLLYADVLLRMLTWGVKADGPAGAALAAEIDRQVPEQHAVAEKYRDQALAFRASGVEKLARKEMLALSDEYAAREQPREAESVRRKWLQTRRDRLRDDDTEGLLQLAAEYRVLLKDDRSAAGLLMQAHTKTPDAAEVVEQLERLGYQLKAGVWLNLQESKLSPRAGLIRAPSEVQIDPGMSVAQVRQALGEPSLVARSATAGHVDEVWMFHLADSSQLAVHLARRRGRDELKVVAVSHLSVP